MKLKEGWSIVDLDGEYAAVFTGEGTDYFHGIVRLNQTGKDVFEGLMEGLNEAQIAAKLVERYDGVDREGAEKAVQTVVEYLKEEGLLTE